MLIAPDVDNNAGMKRGDLAVLLRAGGGQEICQRGATFASVVAAQCNATAVGQADIALFQSKNKDSAHRARLVTAGIPCVDPLFLAEWVTRPWADLKGFFEPDQQAPPHLQELMSQRSITQAAMSQSI